MFSFGSYLRGIPARLGTNKALDSAVDAVVDIHSTVCLMQRPTRTNFHKYNDALRQLRTCLDVPSLARATETLAAVTIIGICHVCSAAA
jgi:hypothetical protein